MAASTKTGYDPSTMQWVDIEVAETREDPIPGEHEYLQIMVRQLQEKLAKMKPRGSTAAAQPQARKTGSTPAACVESPPKLATWKPTQTPRIRSDELVIVLKPKNNHGSARCIRPRRDWYSSATLHRQHHKRWYLRVAFVGPKHRCCRRIGNLKASVVWVIRAEEIQLEANARVVCFTAGIVWYERPTCSQLLLRQIAVYSKP
ncbi:hypothetical protein MRX96_052541 [Rhipicephalus microplus]